jgi:hypothetical protein
MSSCSRAETNFSVHHLGDSKTFFIVHLLLCCAPACRAAFTDRPAPSASALLSGSFEDQPRDFLRVVPQKGALTMASGAVFHLGATALTRIS